MRFKKSLWKHGLFIFMVFPLCDTLRINRNFQHTCTAKLMFATTHYMIDALLYKVGSRGVCVVQQRFNESTKSTYWTEIDPWLNDIIYLKAGFKDFFDSYSEEERNGLYPTVTVRQLMWRLRMKPLKRERWETVIDRKTL